MLEGQFYTRLMLNIIVGMMFAYAMVKMAIHNNQETPMIPHKTMRVFSFIFAGFACLSLIFCIFTTYPTSAKSCDYSNEVSVLAYVTLVSSNVLTCNLSSTASG